MKDKLSTQIQIPITTVNFFHVTFPFFEKKARKRTESILTKSLSIFRIYFLFVLGVATQGESNKRQDFFFFTQQFQRLKIFVCVFQILN